MLPKLCCALLPAACGTASNAEACCAALLCTVRWLWRLKGSGRAVPKLGAGLCEGSVTHVPGPVSAAGGADLKVCARLLGCAVTGSAFDCGYPTPAECHTYHKKLLENSLPPGYQHQMQRIFAGFTH